MCEEYLKSFHKEELINILQEEDTTKHYSIYINFLVLYESCQNLGLDLLNESETALEKWNNAAVRAQLALLKEVDKKCQLKSNIHCRIYNLTTCSQSYGALFPNNKHVGKFVQLSGTVMRMTAAKLLEYQRSYICIKCKTSKIIKADYDKKYIIKAPKKCENPEGCSGTNLVHMGELDSENCKDYQEIKIQERVKESGVDALHNTLLVTLEDDLVDSCKPGDNVTICGLVKRRWGEFDKGKKIEIEITLKANYLQVDNKSFRVAATPETVQLFKTFWENYSENPLLGRDTILKSICPQIYGLYLVKLAVAVVIAGGCQLETTSTGIRTRSESHLLLVGDPGTGKSQLLQFVSKIVPRAVLTTGVGSTAAGLTVTAIMEKGEWQLEAGALVLSDGGVCCIDEFNSMREHDRTSIHEAMEQQTISIAKASLVCKMNTRCSILAACNPKGNVNLSESLSMNVALPSPLLSRFDIVLILKDNVNVEWDTLVADYILNNDTTFSKFARNKLWNEDILQSYFVIIKKILPKLTEDAELILSTYYQMQRRIDNRNKARTTVRLLESLVRLSQGHARLMYHERVEIMDSIYAIILIDSSMERDSSLLNLNINSNSVFPDKPSLDYRNMAEIILNKLHLKKLLSKELEMLDKIKECKVQSRFFYQQNKPTDEDTVNVTEDDPPHELGQNDIICETRKRTCHVEDTEDRSKKLRTIVTVESTVQNCSLSSDTANNPNKENLSTTDEGYDTVNLNSINCNNTSNMTVENARKVPTTINKTIENLEESADIRDIADNANRGHLPTTDYDTVNLNSINVNSTRNTFENYSKVATRINKTVAIFEEPADISPVNTEHSKKEIMPKLNPVESPINNVFENSDREQKNCNDLQALKEIVANSSKHININVEQKEDLLKSVVKNNQSNCEAAKSFLKKFKFIPKPKDDNNKDVVENKGSSDTTNHSMTNDSSNSSRNIATNIESNVKKTNQQSDETGHLKDVGESLKVLTTTKQQKQKSKNTKVATSFENDLELLNLMPGVNDNFNIDLDFDWDNFDQGHCHSSTILHQESNEKKLRNTNNPGTGPPKSKESISKSESHIRTSREDNFTQLSQNSKIKYIHNKFSFTKPIKRLPSHLSSNEDNDTRTDSSISLSYSQAKSIFELEDNIDELDLEL